VSQEEDRVQQHVNAVAVSAALDRVAAAGHTGTVRLWELSSGRACPLVLHPGAQGARVEVTTVAFAGRLLCAGLADGDVDVFDTAGGERRALFRVDGLQQMPLEYRACTALLPCDGGRALLAGYLDDGIRLWLVPDET